MNKLSKTSQAPNKSSRYLSRHKQDDPASTLKNIKILRVPPRLLVVQLQKNDGVIDSKVEDSDNDRNFHGRLVGTAVLSLDRSAEHREPSNGSISFPSSASYEA